MYDASGVRLHAGKAAAVLNHFLGALPEDHHLAGLSLRDKLGHEPEEVAAGAAVGVVVGWMVAGVLALAGGGGGGPGGGAAPSGSPGGMRLL
jgi:acid phosphatase family membrane protein YuiD